MVVGIVGVGNMGRPMAEHLSEVGEVLVLWNRTADKAAGIENSTFVGTPAQVVDGADVILSILANDDAINTAYHGAGGMLEADLTGKTIVEFCTTSPQTVMALEDAVEARGGQFVECPVSGNVLPARSGDLMGLAGGKQAAFDAAKPVLDKLTRRLEHLGPVGSGAAMKLAVNLPLMVYWSALGEAVGLALQKGIDPETALSILVDSSGAIGAAKKRVPPILDMLTQKDPGTVSFSLTNAVKDMKLMQALAQDGGSPSGVISATLAKAQAAADAGWGEFDNSLVGVYGQSEDTA